MPATLPDDLLHLLCAELADQRDFDALYQCAVSGKRFAVPALTHLYRNWHLCPVVDGGTESFSLPQQQLMMLKWSILWRSIVASSLEATLFPYTRYIRVLDLYNLRSLLEEDRFRGDVRE